MYEIGHAEIAALKKIILSKKLYRYQSGNNSECDRFEREFAEKIGVKHAIILSSGTNALVVALAAAGVGPGDEVLVPAYTYVATAVAVKLVGATPVVVNIDESLGLSRSDAEEKLTTKTKAIIPVHMDGIAADMRGIVSLAQKNKLIVIEDCAQALGGSFGKKRLGSIGEIGAFSLNESKNISCGEGGIVVTSNKALYDKMFHLHDLAGRFNPVKKEIFPIPNYLGMSMRVSEIQGAIMRAQLPRLDTILGRLRARKALLIEALQGLPELKIILGHSPAGDCASSLHLRFSNTQSAVSASKILMQNKILATFPSIRPAHVVWKWMQELDRSKIPSLMFDYNPSVEILMTTLKYDIDYSLTMNETGRLAKRFRKLLEAR